VFFWYQRLMFCIKKTVGNPLGSLHLKIFLVIQRDKPNWTKIERSLGNHTISATRLGFGSLRPFWLESFFSFLTWSAILCFDLEIGFPSDIEGLLHQLSQGLLHQLSWPSLRFGVWAEICLALWLDQFLPEPSPWDFLGKEALAPEQKWLVPFSVVQPLYLPRLGYH